MYFQQLYIKRRKITILFWVLLTKVLFKDLNPGIAMAIVRFKFSRKLHFCFESVFRQKFNFSAFSEMAQNFWFWLHWMKRNYVFVLVDNKVSKFKSIQNWNWKFFRNCNKSHSFHVLSNLTNYFSKLGFKDP